MKHSILCVDDESDNVDALERLFRRKYNVLKATSGEDALRLLANEKVALIVTDQRMPNMTGVEFLAESMKMQPSAMRILLTGYTDIESVISAINSGQIYRYVTKPWDPVDLANTVDKAIERFDLSAELEEKNVALQGALKELRGLDEAKSNFMMLINHELKTPLTVILSFLGLLQETKLAGDQTKYVTRVQTAVERLQSLVNDSLELVSAETGTFPVRIDSVDVVKLMGELQETYHSQLKQKKMTLEVDILSREVMTDARALRSILGRLLDNAIKFGRENSVIEFEAGSADGAIVNLSLINDGKTLKPDVIAKILKPFSLDENVMHHSKGAGLGLSVVQALLRRLGSQLEISSPKGRFAAKFSLPIG